MSEKRFTVRLSDADYAALQAKARAAGASASEVVRALIVSGGDGASQSAALADVLGAVIDRLEALESHPSDPAAVPDLAPLERRIEGMERALDSLISVVAQLRDAYRTSPAPAPGSVPNATPADALPPGKQPAPPGGFYDWVKDQPYLDDAETKPQRARRLTPVYNGQFHPEFKLGGV